jgi:hypothetical protein
MAQRFALVVLLVSVACASGSSSTPGSPAPEKQTANPNLITAAELADPEIAAGNVYQAIQRLRPRFLMARGQASKANSSGGTVHFSVDGGPLQTFDKLASYAVADIKQISYLSPTDAGPVYGIAAGSGGVILLKSK